MMSAGQLAFITTARRPPDSQRIDTTAVNLGTLPSTGPVTPNSRTPYGGDSAPARAHCGHGRAIVNLPPRYHSGRPP